MFTPHPRSALMSGNKSGKVLPLGSRGEEYKTAGDDNEVAVRHKSEAGGEARDILDATLRDIFANFDTDHDGQLNPREFNKLLLTHLGHQWSERTLNHVFREAGATCIGSNNGGGEDMALSCDQWVDMVRSFEGTRRWGSTRYACTECFSSIGFIACLLNMAAPTQLVISSCVRLALPALRADDLRFVLIWGASVCWILGCFGYFYLDYTNVRSRDERREQAAAQLTGWCCQPGEGGGSLEYNEETKKKGEAAESGRHRGSMARIHRALTSGAMELTVKELRGILEQKGVFLAGNDLESLYKEVDLDGNGTLSLQELEEYVRREASRPRRSRAQKRLNVIRHMFKTVTFWLLSCFQLGNIANGVTGALWTFGFDWDAVVKVRRGTEVKPCS